jgi:hypothetical protein
MESGCVWPCDQAEPALAVEDWDEVIHLCATAELPHFRASRAYSRIRAGMVDEAVAEVEELTVHDGPATRSREWNILDYYTLACVYALASSKIAAQQQAWEDRAIELLRHSVRAGWNDPAQMVRDSDLAPLREREDFRELISEAARARLIADRRRLPPNSTALAAAMERLAFALSAVRAFDEAESILRDCLAIQVQMGPNDWSTFSVQSSLGGTILGQAKLVSDREAGDKMLAEAEVLMLAGLDGMKQRESMIPAAAKDDLTAAYERLVDLYTTWEKSAEAAKWQAELDMRIDDTEEPTNSTEQ